MEISKSTPYVRYRENISSSLHKGTVHIESEYLDRERKTSIESIEGQTWQNLAVNENKELEMLGVGSIGLSGDIYDTGEKRLAVDVVMGNATPTVNEDGAYTYSVSTMEGEYARTFDGVNHITSTSDGLDGEFHIKYNTQGEEIIGNFSGGKELHTIENSKNGEITSAILKGCTLVNIHPTKYSIGVAGSTTFYATVEIKRSLIKPNSKYFLRLYNTHNSVMRVYFKPCVTTSLNLLSNNNKCAIFTTKEVFSDTDFSNNKIHFYSSEPLAKEDVENTKILLCEYQSGMENWDIPYFEGMQSVKSPVLTIKGKNLVSNMLPLNSNGGNITTTTIVDNNSTISTLIEMGGNVTLTISKENVGKRFRYFMYCENPIKGVTMSIDGQYVDNQNSVTFTTHPDTKYLLVVWCGDKDIDYPISPQIEYGNQATPYKPYKSNTLIANEEVELRGVDNVKDTFDCMTGVHVQRMGVFDANNDEGWTWGRFWSNEETNTTRFSINNPNLVKPQSSNKITTCSNILPSISYNDEYNGKLGISVYSSDAYGFIGRIQGIYTLEELKQKFKSEGLKIVFELVEPITQTIPTLIKDQDGKTSRQLSTYEGTTHVNVSSNGLTPLADISYKMYSTTDVVSGTSVTIEDGKDSDMVEGVVYGNSMVNIAHGVNLPQEQTIVDFQVTNLQEGKTYTIFYDVSAADSGNLPRIGIVGRTTANEVYDNWLVNQSNISLGSGKIVFTMPPFYSVSCLRIHKNDSKNEPITVNKMMLLEGDYTDQDIPYFEGIGSVENPLVTVSNGNLWGQVRLSESWDDYSHGAYGTSLERILKLEPNTKYRINNILRVKGGQIVFNLLEKQANGSYRNLFSHNRTNHTNDVIEYTTNSALTTTTGDMYLQLYPCSSEANFKWGMETIKRSSLTIFKDGAYENNTMIEPESSHLSTTPRITLHGIGDVKDEWDIVNETVTKRVEEIVLDGSESEWSQWIKNGAVAGYKVNINNKFTSPDQLLCDKFPLGHLQNYMTLKNCVFTDQTHIAFSISIEREESATLNTFKQWLSQNPVTVIYELEAPTTKPVLITPQNPKTSTASITINEPLNAVDTIHDKLRWNPYKGCYVRYNHIVDGVSYDQHRTIENLYDLGERQYVDLYEHRTYFLPTNGSMESRTHGTSVYCLAEQGKQYCVRWDWIEAPTVDTIKVDLCGNTKIVPSTETSVVIDATHVQHNFVQLQGNGLQGKFTNLMVIETVDGEIPDVDFFSGVKAIGNTVQVDGVTKVQIDVEQTNGNLFDIEPVIFNNGNYISYCWNENNKGMPIKNGKTYTFKHLKRQDGEWGDYSLRTFDENLKLIRTISLISGAKIREHGFTAQYNEKYIRGFGQMTSNGSTHTHYPVELCYTDMVKDGIRPRCNDMQSFILPMKLCRVGEVYDELYYDDLKGYYRIQQSIGHKYLTGDASERWEMGVINLNSRTVAFTYKNGDINQLAMGDTICNGFKHLKDVNQDAEGFIIYNGDFVLRIDKERIEGNCSIDGLRAYLSSYPIHLFYQLKTPQMVDLPQYPNRLELNTYRDEVFTFIKDSNPTKFTLSIPMDRTYRFDDHQEGQGLANRVSITDERISSENVVAIQEIRGKGIANLIEDPNNVPVTPLPNYSGVATSHQLTNTKPSIVHVHGFEPSGDTKIGTWNVADKKYQIKVMSGNSNYSLSDYYVLDVPYQLETYPDGTKDRVYYNVERQEWQVNGSYDRTIAFNASTGAFTEAVEIFRGMTPRSGMIAEFKLRFTSGTTTARLYYSVNGSTYSYVTLRGMVDDQDYYLAFFNTGGTKIDYSTKVGATTEYTSMTALSATIPEGLFVNQIQSLTECTHYVDKFYQYPTLHTPIELDTYDGTTNIYIDGKTTDTNIIINNDCFQKVVNTYEDVEYTVYWKYLSGDGKLTITLGGTKVEVDGTKEYATIRTQLQASQELVYIGGYNLSIQDVMVVKGARIDGLAYFEGSRQVGTLVVDEHGNKQYKITLVQGGSVLEQKDYDKVEFKDDNKHNVVVHKIVGVRPTKVD